MAAAVENHFVRCNFFQFQRRRPGNQLKRRSWRIFPGNGTVFHRMIGIVINLRPFFCRNAARKPVWIKRRTAGHSKYGTCVRIDSNSGNPMGTNAVGYLLIHSIFCGLLQIQINRQMDIMSGNRIFAFHFFDRTAGCIDFYLSAAVFAAKDVIIIRFQPGTANLCNIRNAFLSFQAFHIFFVNLAYIPKNLRCHFVVRIIPNRLYIDRNARQFVAPFFDFRNDILCQIRSQHRRDIRTFDFLYLFPQFIFGLVNQLGQFFQLIICHAVFGRNIRHHKAGAGTYQNLAVAVIHDTAHGRNRNSAQSVSFCQ